MYNDFKFAEEPKVEIFRDINEALGRAHEIVVNPISATAGDIQVTSDGGIVFGGETKKISSKGIETFFSKVLGIPPLFSRKIPTDLLLHNIANLIKDNPGKEVFILERPDGNIASIVPSPYSEIPYVDILGRFTEKPIRQIEMSESLLKTIFLFDELKVPDLNDNQDTFYVGQYMLSSLTKLTSLQSYSGLYRTQCENSFIMPLLGRMKANYTKKEDVRLDRFAASFECYDTSLVANLMSTFAQSRDKRMKEHQVKQVWDKISTIFSKSDADMLFSFDEDLRKVVLNSASSYLSEVKRAERLGLEIPSPHETTFPYMKIANEITTAAHTRMFDPVDQVKAEVVGGKLLEWMIFLN